MAKDIFDAVYGCLVGGAIGDALGSPVEGWYYDEIRQQHGGPLTDFIPSLKGNTGPRYGESRGEPGIPGAITDDTTLRHYMCLAIVRKGGRISPDDFVKIWQNELNPNRFWINEKAIYHKLKWGVSPWDAGKGSIPAGCATMAIAPIGIINAGNPAQAYQDGFNIAFMNQDDVNRDAAATLAAGVASAFTPEVDVATVIETMRQRSTYLVRRAIDLTLDLAYASASIDEFAAQYYAKMLDWTWPWPAERGPWDKNHFFSGSSLEIVPIAAALLHFCGDDVEQAIIEGANFGRDCDTIGSIMGNIVGAMQGASAIRQDWIITCEAANAAFFEELEGDPNANFRHMAGRMVEALRAERKAAQQRVDLLTTILGQPTG